jgi:hypothetical protein
VKPISTAWRGAMAAVESWAMTALVYSTVRMISIASTFPGNSGSGRHSEIDIVAIAAAVGGSWVAKKYGAPSFGVSVMSPPLKTVRPDRVAPPLA